MRKTVNISLLLGLLGLLNSIHFGPELRFLSVYSGGETTVANTAWGVHNSAIFSVQTMNPVVAETTRNFHSDKDPGSFSYANWTSKLTNGLPQTQYLRNTLSVSLSQSVRVLIYPFHSFL